MKNVRFVVLVLTSQARVMVSMQLSLIMMRISTKRAPQTQVELIVSTRQTFKTWLIVSTLQTLKMQAMLPTRDMLEMKMLSVGQIHRSPAVLSAAGRQMLKTMPTTMAHSC